METTELGTAAGGDGFPTALDERQDEQAATATVEQPGSADHEAFVEDDRDSFADPDNQPLTAEESEQLAQELTAFLEEKDEADVQPSEDSADRQGADDESDTRDNVATTAIAALVAGEAKETDDAGLQDEQLVLPINNPDSGIKCVDSAVETGVATKLPDDWRRYERHAYGKLLPRPTAEDVSAIERSITSFGFIGQIYVDEDRNILDGNEVYGICCRLNIKPVFKVLAGLSKDEKERFAIEQNLGRRQMSIEDIAPLRNRLIDLDLIERNKDSKKLTLEMIAERRGCAISTVSKRAQIFDTENASRTDARIKYDAEQKAEAVRRYNLGQSVTDIANELAMSPKAVRRAITEARKAARSKASASPAAAKKRKAPAPAEDQTTDDTSSVTSDAPTDADRVDAVIRRVLEKAGIGADTFANEVLELDRRAVDAVQGLMSGGQTQELLILLLREREFYRRAQAHLDQKIHELLDEVPECFSCPDADKNPPGKVLVGTAIAVEPDRVGVTGSNGVIGSSDGLTDFRPGSATGSRPIQGLPIAMRAPKESR